MKVAESNVGNEAPPVGQIEHIPLNRLMSAYDTLPRNFRELYDLMPIPMNPEEFHQMIQVYGLEQAYRLMVDFVNANFPSWNGGVKRRAK